MPRPSPSLSRYLLLASAPDGRRPGRQDTPKVRRYRLARVQLGGRAAAPDRFAHLRRAYD